MEEKMSRQFDPSYLQPAAFPATEVRETNSLVLCGLRKEKFKYHLEMPIPST